MTADAGLVSATEYVAALEDAYLRWTAAGRSLTRRAGSVSATTVTTEDEQYAQACLDALRRAHA